MVSPVLDALCSLHASHWPTQYFVSCCVFRDIPWILVFAISSSDFGAVKERSFPMPCKRRKEILVLPLAESVPILHLAGGTILVPSVSVLIS